VHDAEDPELVDLGGARVNRALLDTDVVVTVTAAETVLYGGPAALVAAADAQTQRAAFAESLLETGRALGWQASLELERLLASRTPLIGAALTLDHPTLTGALLGYPYDRHAVDRIASSRLARLFGLLPAPLRMRTLRSLSVELRASAAFGGPPSVAHAEALLRAVETRSVELDEPLDAICIGIPRLTPHLPRERPNPLLAAYLGLGHALRLWRDAFPLRDGGTAILLHRFDRHFAHPTQQPYRAFFRGDDESAVVDRRSIADYRSGRTVHPLLPYADWDGCRPAVERLGRVLVAGCRDAVAARRLGFVPAHGPTAALEMVSALGARR